MEKKCTSIVLVVVHERSQLTCWDGQSRYCTRCSWRGKPKQATMWLLQDHVRHLYILYACLSREDGLSLTFERYSQRFTRCIVLFVSVSSLFHLYSLDESSSVDDTR